MGKRLALIIGNSLYQDQTLARLKAPDVDVGALRDILKDTQVGGFDDVDILFNSDSSNVRRVISEFYHRKSRDDLLLLYFSGHGVLDENGRLYLAVKDSDHDYLRASAISAGFVTEEMDNSRSHQQVLILDCCHSGAFARGVKGSPGSTVGTATAFEGTGSGRVILTASDATQYAWEGDQIIGESQGSLFTHYLVKGLKTGEADSNKDGQITLDELFNYIYDQLLIGNPKQTPQKWSYKQQGDIVIARTQVAASSTQFSIDLHPQRIRSGQAASLTVINHGDIEETFILSLRDQSERLNFSPPTAQLRIPQGRSSTLEFQAQPRQRHLIGRERSYPYTATVSISRGETQAQAGEVIASPQLPLRILLLMLVGVLLPVFLYWINAFQGPPAIFLNTTKTLTATHTISIGQELIQVGSDTPIAPGTTGSSTTPEPLVTGTSPASSSITDAGPIYNAGLITYISTTGDGQTLYYLADDGSPQTLLQKPGAERMRIEAVSPDKKYMAVSYHEDNTSSLAIVSIADQSENIIKQGVSKMQVAYLMDNRLLVVTHGDDEIAYYLADPDGDNLTLLHTSLLPTPTPKATSTP